MATIRELATNFLTQDEADEIRTFLEQTTQPEVFHVFTTDGLLIGNFEGYASFEDFENCPNATEALINVYHSGGSEDDFIVTKSVKNETGQYVGFTDEEQS